MYRNTNVVLTSSENWCGALISFASMRRFLEYLGQIDWLEDPQVMKVRLQTLWQKITILVTTIEFSMFWINWLAKLLGLIFSWQLQLIKWHVSEKVISSVSLCAGFSAPVPLGTMPRRSFHLPTPGFFTIRLIIFTMIHDWILFIYHMIWYDK